MIEHNLFEMENYRELIDEVGVDKFRERFEETAEDSDGNLLKWQDFLRQLTARKNFNAGDP